MYLHKFCLALSLTALFALAGCDGLSAGSSSPADASAAQRMSIGVVNSDQVFLESTAAKEGVAYLDTLGKQLQEELAALQQEAAAMSDSQQGQEKLQQGLAEMQQRFATEQQNVMNRVTTLYQQALDRCLSEQELDLLLGSDMVLASSNAIDMTARVIELMNSEHETAQAAGAKTDDGEAQAPDAGQTAPEEPAEAADAPAEPAGATNSTAP